MFPGIAIDWRQRHRAPVSVTNYETRPRRYTYLCIVLFDEYEVNVSFAYILGCCFSCYDGLSLLL